MTTYDHHGSVGGCFSFGNKPMYGMVDNKYVGVYTTKISKNVVWQNAINERAKEVDDICFYIITEAVSS